MFNNLKPILACCLCLLAVLPVDYVYAEDPVEVVRRYRDRHGPAILRQYADFLAIPNVASDLKNIRRNALFIQEQLQRRG
ncbi:MAG: hypothetical protein MJA83_13155, partial [Gammaproteobacteria bacterium]|nr:hypothetical protein [Gammaproteobacteria bacterium]